MSLNCQADAEARTGGHTDRAVDHFQTFDQITIQGGKLGDFCGQH